MNGLLKHKTPALFAAIAALFLSAFAFWGAECKAAENGFTVSTGDDVSAEVLDASKYRTFFDEDEVPVLVINTETLGSSFSKTGKIVISGAVSDSSLYRVYALTDGVFERMHTADDEVVVSSGKVIVVTMQEGTEELSGGSVRLDAESTTFADKAHFIIVSIMLVLCLILMVLYFAGML